MANGLIQLSRKPEFFIRVNSLEMYILAKKLLRSYKGTKCASTDRANRNKNSEQSAYTQIRSAILFFACQTGLWCFFFLKEVSDFFFFALAFAQCIRYRCTRR